MTSLPTSYFSKRAFQFAIFTLVLSLPKTLLAAASASEPFSNGAIPSLAVPSSPAPLNFVWTLLAAFLVMFMQAGFALVATGLCRARAPRTR